MHERKRTLQRTTGRWTVPKEPTTNETTPKEENMITTTTTRKAERLTSTEMCIRYGVSATMLSQWKMYEAFPHRAAVRVGPSLMWDPEPVDRWLHARRKKTARKGTGRPASWEAKVAALVAGYTRKKMA